MSVLSQLCDLSPPNLEKVSRLWKVWRWQTECSPCFTHPSKMSQLTSREKKNKRIGDAITRGEDNHAKVGEKFSQNVNNQIEGSKNIKIRPTPKLRDRDNLRWEHGGREGFTSGFAIQMICLNI